MSDKSKIEWTDATWNPIRGCNKISPGCKNCYAETFAERFRGVPGHPYEQGFDLRFVPEKLAEPLRWTKPKMIFVNSMSDLFHEEVPDDYIVEVAAVMRTANWHTYQVLTKRSERLRDLLHGPLRLRGERPHIWWGVSVENRQHGLPRIDHLRSAPAAVRFLSVEPLLEDLGTIDLDGISLGDRRRRKRPRRPANASRMGASASAISARAPACRSSSSNGAARQEPTGRKLDGRTHDDRPVGSPHQIVDAGMRLSNLRRFELQVVTDTPDDLPAGELPVAGTLRSASVEGGVG